jgi:hypothetical protein
MGQGYQKAKPIASRRLPGFQKKSPTILQTIGSNSWVHVDSTNSFFPDREKGLEISREIEDHNGKAGPSVTSP